MEDTQILQLYIARNEDAIKETDAKYGRLCFQVANNLLYCQQDAEECVNDTYLCSWNSIPPKMPSNMMAFLCKITRNLSLKRLEFRQAQKRTPEQTVSFEELKEVLPDDRINSMIEDRDIGRTISQFLRTETPDSRNVFLRRYWYFDSIRTIARTYRFSESKVKSMLFHTRRRLKEYLKKEGIAV